MIISFYTAIFAENRFLLEVQRLFEFHKAQFTPITTPIIPFYAKTAPWMWQKLLSAPEVPHNPRGAAAFKKAKSIRFFAADVSRNSLQTVKNVL